MPNTTCHCKKKYAVKKHNSVISTMASIIIVLLPKCSFCVLSYSSAIVLCSGITVSDHASSWTSWISISLSFITLLFTLLNFRGIRTIIASLFILVGSGFIFSAELINGQLGYYHFGTLLLLLGIWLNGSFYYVFYRWIQPIIKFIWERGVIKDENLSQVKEGQ